MNGIDLHQILRLIFAMLFVLALMGMLNVVVKRVYGTQLQTGNKKRRLQIVETLPIDVRRRLVLLRRDDREHLVILGTNGETVIEQGIESGQNSVSLEEPSCPQPILPNL